MYAEQSKAKHPVFIYKIMLYDVASYMANVVYNFHLITLS